VSAFVVPSGASGLRLARCSKKMGLHGSPTGSWSSKTSKVRREPAGAEARDSPSPCAPSTRPDRDLGQALGHRPGGGRPSRAPSSRRGAASRAMTPACGHGDPARSPPACLPTTPLALQPRPVVHPPGVDGQAPLHRYGDAAGDRRGCSSRGSRTSPSDIRRHLRDAKALQICEGSNQVQRSLSLVTCWASSPHGFRVWRAGRNPATPSGARPGQGRSARRRDRREGGVSEGHRELFAETASLHSVSRAVRRDLR